MENPALEQQQHTVTPKPTQLAVFPPGLNRFPMSKMPTCIICLDALKSPVCLPCGHIFCLACLQRIVTSVQPFAALQQCPTCRSPYCIDSNLTAGVDPSLVPQHLRAHILPAVRRVFLDSGHHTQQASSPVAPARQSSSKATPPSTPATVADVAARLRVQCETWRRRAEVHAAATLGLVGLARVARDHALRMKTERDKMEQSYIALKRKYDEISGSDDVHEGKKPARAGSPTSPTTDEMKPPRSTSPAAAAADVLAAARGVPVSMQTLPEAAVMSALTAFFSPSPSSSEPPSPSSLSTCTPLHAHCSLPVINRGTHSSSALKAQAELLRAEYSEEAGHASGSDSEDSEEKFTKAEARAPPAKKARREESRPESPARVINLTSERKLQAMAQVAAYLLERDSPKAEEPQVAHT